MTTPVPSHRPSHYRTVGRLHARHRKAVFRRRGQAMGRQMAMVFDLNKCIGCQTCSVACKVLWTQEEGMEHQWWCTVNTQPGRGTPKDWETMGGGERGGVPVPGHLPTREEFGGGWEFD